jgi:hypothetical protein
MNHWTQESAKDLAYHLSLDFFTQLQDRFEESELMQKEFAQKVQRSPGRVSQIFNSPPPNPKVDSVVRYAQALGLKVSIVAYDDEDGPNDKGPIFSGVFAKCWEVMGKPRDLSLFAPVAFSNQMSESSDDVVLTNQITTSRKPPQSAQNGLASGHSNMVGSSL